MSETPGRRPGRLWLALAAGLIFAVPVGWLLAPVAVLPAFLGLYFFLILGLLIGAVMYRLGIPAAPVSRRRLYWLGGLTAASLWFACLVGEYQYLPKGAFKVVRASINMTLAPERREHVRSVVADHVTTQLEEQYRPGGMLGYIRWAVTDGTMRVPRVIDNAPLIYILPGGGWRWIVRVVLSYVLTAGGILSQLLGLASNPTKVDESTDEVLPSPQA